MQQVLTVFTIWLSLARFWRAFVISGVGGFELPNPSPLDTPLIIIPLRNIVTFFHSYRIKVVGSKQYVSYCVGI